MTKRLLLKDYVPYAPEEAGQIKIKHEHCESGKDHKSRLYIKREHDGTILGFCHNCGAEGAHRPRTHIANMYDLLDAQKARLIPDEEVDLPSDIEYNVKEWSLYARAQLYRYDITDAEIAANYIGYSPKYDRIITPTFYKGKVYGWQGRSLDVTKNPPKYVGISSKKGTKPMSQLPRAGVSRREDCLILTEDFVSAMRCGRHAHSMALMGTHLPDETLSLFDIDAYKTIIIFLDDDNPTVVKQQADLYRKLTTMTCAQIGLIKSEGKDPKEHGRQELLDQLDGVHKIIAGTNI